MPLLKEDDAGLHGHLLVVTGTRERGYGSSDLAIRRKQIDVRHCKQRTHMGMNLSVINYLLIKKH